MQVTFRNLFYDLWQNRSPWAIVIGLILSLRFGNPALGQVDLPDDDSDAAIVKVGRSMQEKYVSGLSRYHGQLGDGFIDQLIAFLVATILIPTVQRYQNRMGKVYSRVLLHENK